MNLRKGFGRIYTVLCGLILLGICIAGVAELPKKGDVDRLHVTEIERLIPEGGRTLTTNLGDACKFWSDFSMEVKSYCDGREVRLRDLPSKQREHAIERFGYLIITAAGLYAMRRAARWIADGFAGKN